LGVVIQQQVYFVPFCGKRKGDTLKEADPMDKHKYYVTIQSGTNTAEVRDDNFFEEGMSFDFELECSPEEAQQLQNLFMKGSDEDFKSYLDGHIPFPTDKPEKDNDQYTQTLLEIYQRIYDYGTEETKSKIEKMGVLEALKNLPGQGLVH
jgi:hypothetical protein